MKFWLARQWQNLCDSTFEYVVPRLFRVFLILAVAAFLVGAVFGARVATAGELDTPRAATRPVMVEGSKYANGSGVMIRDGIMLTAQHVAKIDGILVNGQPVTVLAQDQERDIAVLRVKAACPCVAVRSTDVPVDTPITAVGYPLNAYAKVQVATHGTTQGYAAGRLVHTAPMAPGNSGGGLFVQYENGTWELIGINIQIASTLTQALDRTPVFTIGITTPRASIEHILRAAGL